MGIFTIVKTFFLRGKSSIVLYVVAGLVIASVGGYIYYQDSKIEKQKKEIISLGKENTLLAFELNSAITTNEENEKEFDRYKTETKEMFWQMQEHHKQKLKKAKQFARINERIENVQKEDDAIAAPVLVNTFEWLQQLQSEPTKSDNKDKSDQARDTK